MPNIEENVNMTIRIDKQLKKEIDILFKNLGLTTSSAINMFLKQCNREQGLPFLATMNVPNKELLNSLQESQDILNGKIKAKKYKDFDELINDTK